MMIHRKYYEFSTRLVVQAYRSVCLLDEEVVTARKNWSQILDFNFSGRICY